MEALPDVRCGRNLDAARATLSVADFLSDQANVRPEILWLAEESRLRFQRMALSKRHTKSSREILSALQISLSSTKSIRLSPDSYLLTKDCGRRRRAASSTWVTPS